jgi:hypothetical protein
MMLTTHPHLVLRSWVSRSYTSSLHYASMVCSGTASPFTLIEVLLDLHMKHGLYFTDTNQN